MTPRENKSASGFLPDIKTTSNKSVVHSSKKERHKSNMLSQSFPAPRRREKTMCEYWTNLKSMYLIPKHLVSGSCTCYIDFRRSTNRASNKADAQSAPVITQTFEDTLLPTHNIFFAGRPPSPKRPPPIVKVRPEVIDTDPIIMPLRSRREDDRGTGRRVKFLDQAKDRRVAKAAVPKAAIRERRGKIAV